MKIKKNGEVIRLTESDLKKIVKRVLIEQHETGSLYVKLTDEHLEDILEKIAHHDEEVFSHLQHEIENGIHSNHDSNFMDTLNHNLHAHYDPYSNHLKLEFPHLGKHHDIELDIESSFGHHDSHGNEPINLELHPTFGTTFKIPLHYHSKH